MQLPELSNGNLIFAAMDNEASEDQKLKSSETMYSHATQSIGIKDSSERLAQELAGVNIDNFSTLLIEHKNHISVEDGPRQCSSHKNPHCRTSSTSSAAYLCCTRGPTDYEIALRSTSYVAI